MSIYSKILKIVSIVFFASFNVAAQTIKCEKQSDTEIADLDYGMASVVFQSTLGDWVIKPIKADRVVDCRRSDDGKSYVYEFLADVSKDRERTYILGRRGSAVTDQCVVKDLKKGHRVVYKLSEQADDLQRIEVQKQTDNGLSKKKDTALVDITTTIKELKLSTVWPVKDSTQINGARLLEVSVDMLKFSTMKNELDSLKELLAVKEKEDNYSTLDKIDELEHLQKTVHTLDSIFNIYATLTIGGSGIKPIPINLADLGYNERRRYAVVALTESFEDLLGYARSLRDGHNSHIDYAYYSKMCSQYKKALEHKDVPVSQVEALREEYNQMMALRNLMWQMQRSQELVDEEEHKGGINSDGVFKYLLIRWTVAKKIMKEYPEIEGVQEVRDSVYDRIKKHKNYTKE